jgi:hypothetical protein
MFSTSVTTCHITRAALLVEGCCVTPLTGEAAVAWLETVAGDQCGRFILSDHSGIAFREYLSSFVALCRYLILFQFTIERPAMNAEDFSRAEMIAAGLFENA